MNQSASDATWRDYEKRAYELFCSTGHTCEKDVVIKGARGTHQIDVLVSLNISPPGHRWLIECKNWGRSVGKHEVEAFKTVIDDIGADHGYILTEHGFQKGAVEIARMFNISLASLSQFEQQFAREQIDPLHQQSRAYWASVEVNDDTGNFDCVTTVELRPYGARSLTADLIEVHVFREGSMHKVISREDCRLSREGNLCFNLPWDIPDYLETYPIEIGGGKTGKAKDGTWLSGPYTMVFRTLAGPVHVHTYVPTFK